jgi:Sulfotransferase family
MAIVRINHVEQPPPPEHLLGASLDAPAVSATSSTYSFNVRGWALGRDAEVESFQVMDGERIAAEVPPNQTRSDVSGSFPDVAGAEGSGFQTLVRAIELPPTFRVEVVAVLGDGTRCRLATITGEREPLAVGRTPALQPLMLTTIGRSGSKWLAWLVSCHPSIVAFQPLVFEPRVTTYWATVFRALTAPRSYLRQIHTERWDEPRWWLGDGSGPLPSPVELGIAGWLGTDAVRQIGAACQERAEAFYLEVMEKSGKTDVRYFAEKCLLDPVLLDLTAEIFPDAREVILVRDFRDRLSSVFAWNEKRDDHGFGHSAEMSKAEYLTERVRADAEGLLHRWRRHGDAAHLVRYEDLILEPAATLTGLLEFLQLDPDASLVERVLEDANQPRELLDAHRTVSDPAETIGRWRRDLPRPLAEECNEILAPVLAGFGYSTDLEAVEGGE